MSIKSPFHEGGVIDLNSHLASTFNNPFAAILKRLPAPRLPFPTEVYVVSNPSIKAVNTDIPIIYHHEAKFPEEADGGKEPLAYYEDKPIYDMAEYFKICTEIMIETISAHIIRTPGKPDIIVDKPQGNNK